MLEILKFEFERYSCFLVIYVCLRVVIFFVTENLKLSIIDMVRTRGNLSRRGSHDARKSSAQGAAQRRPTASTGKRGQHEADVVEDVVVLHEASNVAQDEEQGIGNDGAGFSGGPSDTSLLTRYQNHVARIIWEGQVSKKFL